MAVKPWYKRASVLVLIVLTILTAGFLLPTCIATIKRHKQLRLIAIANCVSFVISLQFSSPVIFLVSWFGLLLVTIFSKRNQTVEVVEESQVVAPVVSTPSSPVWEPPKAEANEEEQSQPVASVVNEEQPESTQIEVKPDFIWSKKAQKKKANITKRLSTILVGGEQIYGVSSTNRVRGAIVDFICATDARLIVFNSNGSFESKYEWAMWSDLHPVDRKISAIFPNTVLCKLKDGTEVSMGQILEKKACDDFFGIINQFVATPPNLNLEEEIRKVESARFEKVHGFASSSMNLQVVSGQGKQKMTFSQWVKFKRLYKQQISVTERSFVNAYQLYVGLLNAYNGFKDEVSRIDLSTSNSASEQNIFSISGCSLIEVRKGARVTHRESSYSGSSTGGSVRVGRVRVGGGSSGGSSSSTSISYPAPDELTRVDRGNFLVTNLRVSYAGSMFTKSAEFKKIAEYRAKSRQVLIAPRSGSKVWIVEFPSVAEAWTAKLLLETALATPQKRLDEKAESIYGDITGELKGNFNRSIAEIELAIQESEDELQIFRDVWGELLSQYPGRLNALISEMSAEKPEFGRPSIASDGVTLSLLWVPNGTNEKIEIIKAIRSATNLSLSEAKNAVDNVPSILGTNFEIEVAEALQSNLQYFGAASEIR
jgi:ribosomal protein L7/L12